MRIRFSIAILGVLALTAPSLAQQAIVAGQPTHRVELSTAQRSEIAQTIISRWMGQVLESPGGDVKAWSSKLRKVIATADSANVIRASTMPSLDLTHAALVGAAVNDAAVKAALSGTTSTSAPQVLGSTIADTTYTPLPGGRCRIASSLAIAAPLAAGLVRGIDVEDVESFSTQGGVGSLTGDGSVNCGIPPLATALALSVSARNPVANGVLKVFPNNRPNAAGNTIFFSTAAAGGGSDLIVESCQSCAVEISIMSTVQTDYIIDVLGYFMPAQATALECVRPDSNNASVASGQELAVSGTSCSAGFTLVSTTCASSNSRMPILAVNYGSCKARNDDSVAATLSARNVCCRVPGR